GSPLDPEALRTVAGDAAETVTRLAERHGASVERLPSGVLMALFGIPVLHEDDALRAVLAATDIGASLEGSDEQLARDSGVRAVASIGLDTGEVVLDEGAGVAGVEGVAVGAASRLQRRAEPGEILLGEQTERLVREAIEAEQVDSGAAAGAWRLI